MAKHAYVPGSKIGRHGRVSSATASAYDDQDNIGSAVDVEDAVAFPKATAPHAVSAEFSEGEATDFKPSAGQDPSTTADLTQPLESVPVDPAPAPRYGQYGQAPEEAPRYAVPPTPLYDTREEPVPFRSWFVAILLASIPFVNIVVLIVYAFGRTQSASQRNWARALLLWAVIVSLCAVFLTVIGVLHPATWAAIL